MPRTTSSVASHRRKKKVLKLAKGARGGRSKLYRTAKETVAKGLMYATRDRKVKKRDFRRLWISRINAGLEGSGLSYSRFIEGLIRAKVKLNRKIISELAIHEKDAFAKLVKLVKEGNV